MAVAGWTWGPNPCCAEGAGALWGPTEKRDSCWPAVHDLHPCACRVGLGGGNGGIPVIPFPHYRSWCYKARTAEQQHARQQESPPAQGKPVKCTMCRALRFPKCEPESLCLQAACSCSCRFLPSPYHPTVPPATYGNHVHMPPYPISSRQVPPYPLNPYSAPTLSQPAPSSPLST